MGSHGGNLVGLTLE